MHLPVSEFVAPYAKQVQVRKLKSKSLFLLPFSAAFN